MLKKLSLILALFFTVFFLLPNVKANAQTASKPQLAVTWQASESYVPPGYPGKALPNQISKVSASLSLVVNGRQVDLSGQTIYWYQNGILIGGGQGIRSISFSTLGGAPTFITLRAELPSYQGAILIHDIQIPIIQPKAI